MPRNSHGAGAPSRGNAGAGKGHRRRRLGAPTPQSVRPSQLHFFVLSPSSQREGLGSGGRAGRASERERERRVAARCSPRLIGLRRPARLPAAPAPHALRRREPRRSRGRAAAGGRLVPGSVWGPGAPPVATPDRSCAQHTPIRLCLLPND